VPSGTQPTSPAPSRRGQPTATAPARRAPRSQRERLIDAFIELAAKDGSQTVTVLQVSSHAGVSSATFYEQFENKQDCLLAAYRTAAERLLALAPPGAQDGGDWRQAACGTLRELAGALRDDPDAGRLLFLDTLAAGAGMRETRAAALAAFEQRVQGFLDSVPAGDCTIDVPVPALVGATRSIVARQLRTHGENELPALAQDGVEWALSYAVGAGRRRWSTGPGALLPAASKPTKPRPAPRRLPRGRHGLPPGVVARSHRTRILYGTAEVMHAKGYQDATVADIVAAAGVSREVFYAHFSDKQHAFLETQNHPTQHILDRCASAYFSGSNWPQRIWNMLRTLLEMIAKNPAISQLRLVECYAAGPEAIRRAEEITRSFTIFLEEGYRYRPEAEALPKLCTQAITGGVFEIIQRHAARRDYQTLPSLLPQLTYINLAPFMGAENAISFLRDQIRQQASQKP
jgi:AcrR family transcriptional regulator